MIEWLWHAMIVCVELVVILFVVAIIAELVRIIVGKNRT